MVMIFPAAISEGSISQTATGRQVRDLNTAKALGIEVSPVLLARADEVIE
jgi:hypothetical protein